MRRAIRKQRLDRAVCIHQQSVCPNPQSADRPSESKGRLHARFRQSAPVSFLETRADARRGCDFHGLKYVQGHDHKKGLVVHLGGTQWHDKGNCSACLGIPGRLLPNSNSGVYLESARGDCGISSDARQGSHFECTVSESSFAIGYSRSCANFGSLAARKAACSVFGNWRKTIPASFASEQYFCHIQPPICRDSSAGGARFKRRVI